MPEELVFDETTFYDPILELLIPRLYVQKERIESYPFPLKEKLSQLSYELINNTVELGRLRFLRQAGFAWLEFPSATHTRFAHSLGSLTCGITALDHIRVIGPTVIDPTVIDPTESQRPIKLRDAVGERETDFLLALLLHDIGHLPFSHVLENNPDIISSGINHEILTVDLIMGENKDYEPQTKIYEIMKKKADEAGIKTVSQVLHKAKEMSEEHREDIIHPEVICALISKNVGKKNSYDILNGDFYLKGLISGIIDLDRLDHYARDSFFMGVKLATFNVLGFLRSITLDTRDATGKKNYGNVHTLISEDGVPHVLQLLFSKELLWSKALDNREIRAYECMLSKAFSLGKKKLIKTSLDESEILTYRDDDLLYALLQKDGTLGKTDEMVRRLVNRIIYGHPHKLLVTGERKLGHNLGTFEKIRQEMLKKHELEDDDLLFYARETGDVQKSRDIQWHELRVRGKKGPECIKKGEDRDKLCNYLQSRDDTRKATVRFFVSDSVEKDKDKKEDLRKEIRDYF